MGRAPCCDKTKVRKGPWTREEDARLIAYIRDYGHNNWRALPQEAGLARCGKSCRLRWVNYLKPDVKRGPFTLEEEEMILKLHETLGNKWSRIAAHFPGRTDNEIKNVWNSYFKKKLAGVDFLSRKKKKVNSSSSNNNNNNSNDDDDNNDIHGYSPFSQSTSTISSISIEGSSPNQALGNDGQNDPFLVEAMGNFQFENVMEDEFPLGAESSRNWEVDEGPSQLHYQQPPPMDQPKCQSSVTDIKEGGGRGGEGDKGTEESDLEWMTNLENYLRQDQTTNNDVFDFAPWFSPIPKL